MCFTETEFNKLQYYARSIAKVRNALLSSLDEECNVDLGRTSNNRIVIGMSCGACQGLKDL